jgi:hypothetical protein
MYGVARAVPRPIGVITPTSKQPTARHTNSCGFDAVSDLTSFFFVCSLEERPADQDVARPFLRA